MVLLVWHSRKYTIIIFAAENCYNAWSKITANKTQHAICVYLQYQLQTSRTYGYRKQTSGLYQLFDKLLLNSPGIPFIVS